MPQVDPAIETFARIKVIGVGGAGGAAINRMVEAGVDGVEFIAVNTDAQALHYSKASVKIHIGKDTTRGLGAGADPDVGEKADGALIEKVKASVENVKTALAGTDIEAIKAASDELQKELYEIGSAAYAQAEGAEGDATSGAGEGSKASQEDVMDADYTVVDEEKKD